MGWTNLSCIRKLEISDGSHEVAIAKVDNPFQKLQNRVDDLLSIRTSVITGNIDEASFTDDDAAMQPSPTDADTVTGLLETEWW